MQMEGVGGWSVWFPERLLRGRLVRFGYAVLTSEKDTILGPKGIRMPVHEFHYWDTTCESGCFEAVKPMTGRRWQCIYQKKQMLAGFPHFYFNANREMAVHYLEACRKYSHHLQSVK